MPSEELLSVIVGDNVAVMPTSVSPPTDVLEIQTVEDVGPVFIRLRDGRTFAQLGGAAVSGKNIIVRATDEHHFAMVAKRP
jgi:hypothetical protein